jgi:hypothetical protein
VPYTTRPLDASTWDAFAELVERNKGNYGGCWCIAYPAAYQRGVSDPRVLKEKLVRVGSAHPALVFDEDGITQGWCQYGRLEELGLKHNGNRPKTHRHPRTGGSPRSSSTSGIADTGSHEPSSRARSGRSPTLVGAS